MATITSSTSGNFSNAAIWVGGVGPVDNDSFIIANSHVVTYDVTTPVTTGFNDSDIYGTLQHQASANTVLRMNGRLRIRTNGCYYMCDGARLQFRGIASASHILYMLNESNASFIADGSDGMPSTTLSQEYAQGNSFIQVANAASFRPGEWIAVFNNTFQIANSQAGPADSLRDEGFWIHDVQANTLFIRQYVGPENSTVTSYTNNVITVANSKVWRVGQTITFGTGANRNIKNIIGINYAANTLTVNGPNLANDSVYRAGAWSNVIANATFTTGIDAPDGSTDAVRWTQSNTGVAILRVNIPTVTTNGTDTYALSFWARFISGVKTNLYCDFNDTNPQGDYSSTLVANEWRRVVFTGIPTAGSRTFIDIVTNNSATNNVVDFWGLQLEVANTITNNSASEYIPTAGTVRSIRGTVTGNTIYETGSDKIHGKTEKVRKIATLTTQASNSAQTTITVANVSSFLANDEIWIEARSECGSTSDRLYNAYPRAVAFVHNVASISANTITLSGAIGYNVVAGALVTRLTRRIIVEPVAANSSYYGMYTNSFTTNYTRRLMMKDIQFRYVGSSQGAVESGVYIDNGFYSSSNPPVVPVNTMPRWDVGPWMEGVTLTGSNSTRDLGGFFNYAQNGQVRASASIGIFNSNFGAWYRDGIALYNSIASGSSLWGIRAEYYGAFGEVAYNYSSRNDRGFRLLPYDTNYGTHHMIIDCHNGEMYLPSPSPIPMYKFKITGGTYGINPERGNALFYYSQYKRCSAFGNSYDPINPGTLQRGLFHTQIDRGVAGHQLVEIIEDDFEIDKHRQFAHAVERYWDATENAWRVIHITDGEDAGSGWFTWIYVPARTTLRASCQIKLAPSFGTNYPIFVARAAQGSVDPNRVGNVNVAGNADFRSWYSGGSVSNTYTALSSTQYEERQITVAPTNFPRHISVGIWLNNRNQYRGFWMRDINTYLDTPYVTPTFKFAVKDGGSGNFGVQSNFDSRKIRIGGGRIKGT